MKKIISAVLSATLAVSSIGAVYASADEKYGDGKNIVVFGDSIAEGYDLSGTEYNYGQIIADYIGGNVSNYAKAGDETTDTLSKIKESTDLKDADVVIISSGANDVIHYSSNFMLKLFSRMGCLAEGYTADDIPENPAFSQMMQMIDVDKLKSSLSDVSEALKFNNEITRLANNLTITDSNRNYEQYDRVIQTKVIANTEQMVAEIKAVNPDARIIVQNIYNPLQLEENYVPDKYKQMFALFKPTFERVVDSYVEQLDGVEGVEIADIYTDFTAGDGYAWYFTGFEDASVKEFKVHPNQAGHLAIAVNILNILGEKNDDGGLLNLAYEKLDKKDQYPNMALEKYRNIAGTYVLGNINGDTLIDANDATEVLATYSALSTGQENPLSEENQKAADVNGDGNIDANDASNLLDYYAYSSTGGTSSLKRFQAENK
ncbi:MAG: hypothetical protein K2K91_05145 [Ruminococcus sp.]|nr:hypothetical protein [Ruminococcus sp.]MDE7097737.1 hypothetical protein [Ruminococcus sp.]